MNNKRHLGDVNALYPLPVVIVGCVVNGKPNFVTVGHVGIVTHELISISLGNSHYSNAGIKENGFFSVNIPSAEMLQRVDYAGLMSGAGTDKSDLFEVFYNGDGLTPMISEAPVNMECALASTFSFGSYEVFIGKISATFADEECINEGIIDISKLNPLLFDMASRKYWELGKPLGSCWSQGYDFKS